MNAVFNYKDQKVIIQCNPDDKMINICKKFSIKIDADVNSKIYIYKSNLLNLDLTYREQIQNTQDSQDEIKVFDNTNLVTIKYNYGGQEKEVQLPRQENILKRISSIIKTPFDRINILLNGELASEEDLNKDFNKLSNNQNKNDNSINLIISEREEEEDDDEELSKKKDDDNKDEKKKKKKEVKPFVKWTKSLFKIYLISIVQLLLIEIFLFLGFYFEINKIFTESLGLTLGVLIPSSFVCGLLSFFMYLYQKTKNIKKYKKCTCCFLGIYPLFMIFYFFILSKFIEVKYILSILNLLLLDYASAIFTYMILKIKKKYAYIAITFVINLIYLVIFFFIIEETNTKAIVLMSTVAILMILYNQIFNYSQLFFFNNDDEYIYATEIFNYFLFAPAGVIYILIILLVFAILFALLVILAGILDSLFDKDVEIV